MNKSRLAGSATVSGTPNPIRRKAVLVHGIDGKPEGSFRPWLKCELEKSGFEVIIPRMPNSSKPTLGSWMGRLVEKAGEPDKNTYIVGHSAGGAAALAYIEALNGVLGGLLLVAACCKPLAAVRKTWDFFPEKKGNFDWKRIRERCGKFAALHSDNDLTVPVVHAEIFREKLGAELVMLPGMGHFHTADGAARLPVARDIILDWAGIRTRKLWTLVPPGT